MKSLLSLVLLLLLATSASAQLTMWQRYAAPEGRFSVLLPGTPKIDSIKGSSGATSRMYTVKTADGAVYIAAYASLPNVQPSVFDTTAALAIIRDSIVSQSKLKVASEREMRIGGVRGREIIGEVSNNTAIFTTWIFVVRGELYQLVSIVGKEKIPEDDIKRFFSSFVIGGSGEVVKLKSALEATGLTFTEETPGEFKVSLKFQSGRQQIVMLNTETSPIYNSGVYNLWSIVYSGTKPVRDTMMRRLLAVNGTMSLGAFSIVPTGSKGQAAVFSASVLNSLDADGLKRAIVHVGSVADAIEKEGFNIDQN